MIKSKFITLVQTLSSKELKEFNQFLGGLYAKQKVAICVFNFIQDHLSGLLDQTIIKDDLLASSELSPFQLTDKGFSNALSDLYRFLEEFLIWKRLQIKGAYEKDFQMIQILKERKLDQLYFKQLNLAKRRIEDQSEEDAWEYLKLMELDYAHFFHTKTDKLDLRIESLASGMHHLDLFFTLTKLKFACEMLNRKNILQEEYEVFFLNETFEYGGEIEGGISVLHNLYKLAYDLLKSGNESVYYLLKKEFTVVKPLLKYHDKAVLLGYLINYAVAKTRKENTRYREEILSLYKISLNENLLIEDGIITTSSFINIVNAACMLEDFPWAHSFIEKYQGYLLESIKEQVLDISRAYISFAMGDFGQVLEGLKLVALSKYIDFSLRSRCLILRAEYELYGRVDAVYDSAKAFELSVKRNKKINRRTLMAYLDFIRFVKQFFRKKINKEKIIYEIEYCSDIYFKEWLIEKIEELDTSK